MHVIGSLEPRKVMKMPSRRFGKGFIELWSKPVVKEGGFGGFLKKRAMMACISPQCQDIVLGCYRS